MQTLNPFNFQTKEVIKPLLESFLQDVNSVYYLITPDHLWSYLDLALDTTGDTSHPVMAVVCICIALGCQTSPAGAPSMAVLWYENGRRYLDSQDWGVDPTVMQILALISMFHMAQRPTTSSHYLGTVPSSMKLCACAKFVLQKWQPE